LSSQRPKSKEIWKAKEFFGVSLAEQAKKTAEVAILSFKYFVFIFLNFVLCGVGMLECPDNISYNS